VSVEDNGEDQAPSDHEQQVLAGLEQDLHRDRDEARAWRWRVALLVGLTARRSPSWLALLASLLILALDGGVLVVAVRWHSTILEVVAFLLFGAVMLPVAASSHHRGR
jgi:hypothetical protein